MFQEVSNSETLPSTPLTPAKGPPIVAATGIAENSTARDAALRARAARTGLGVPSTLSNPPRRDAQGWGLPAAGSRPDESGWGQAGADLRGAGQPGASRGARPAHARPPGGH